MNQPDQHSPQNNQSPPVDEEVVQAFKDAYFAGARLMDAEAEAAYDARPDVVAMRMSALNSVAILDIKRLLRVILMITSASLLVSLGTAFGWWR